MPRMCWKEQLWVSCEFVTIRGVRILCGAQDQKRPYRRSPFSITTYFCPQVLNGGYILDAIVTSAGASLSG
jgi:hypothetical protein